mmetsp:Transcript_109754/g.173396  ORF Transcript_109754/g.173396 Transcript_109754/m.173396 type:complete len:152 (-) Transcript_109754:216-671(-)
MAPTGNGRTRAESPAARQHTEKEGKDTSEKTKSVTAEKVNVQPTQTKSSGKDADVAKTTSRLAKVRSCLYNRKIVLSFLMLACGFACGTLMMLWKPDFAITDIFAGVGNWFIQKSVYGVPGMIGCFTVAAMTFFRKSLVKKLSQTFAKKQA